MSILLAGNGFDLYHNLPTKYENFLHTMEYIIHHNKNEIINKPIGNIFSSIENKDSLIKSAYEKYKSAYDEIYFKEEDLDEILSLSNNLWLNYFIEIFDRDLGWIDFEREISIVLNSFKEYFIDTNKHINQYLNQYQELNLNAKHDFNQHMRFNRILIYFPFFIKKGDDSNDFDIPKKEYEKYEPLISNIHGLDEEKTANELFNILIDLTKLLNKYLEYFVEKPLRKIDRSLINKKKHFEKMNCVVTFNYTDTCELLYNIPDDKVFHIHGKVNDKIILGVNPDETDELDNIDVTFIKFKKYYQRTFLKTDFLYLSFIKRLKNTAKQQYDTLSREAVNLTVAGHSLDKTDEDIIKELFEYCSDITILCHNNTVIGQYITNLVSIYGKTQFENLRREKNLKFVKYNELN